MIRAADDDGRPWVVCLPTDQPARVVEGAIRVKCWMCGREVWLAPSSVKLDGRAVCIPCFRARQQPGDTFAPLTAEQIAEAKEALQPENRSGNHAKETP